MAPLGTESLPQMISNMSKAQRILGQVMLALASHLLGTEQA